jgi:hypothetical protein
MSEAPEAAAGEAVAGYKALLRAVCDNRPSGTRQGLARALGTNRSFVSQLTNPASPTPIPAQHLPVIFEICHFSPAERAAFLAAYDRAHPGRRGEGDGRRVARIVPVVLPDLGDAAKNRVIDGMLADYTRHLTRIAELLSD